MNRKILVSLVAMVVILGSFVGLRMAKASSVDSIFLLKNKDFNFRLIDTTGATSQVTYTLPSVVHNDGQVFVFKKIGDNAVYGVIDPAPGETIETHLGGEISLGNVGDYITLVADEA